MSGLYIHLPFCKSKCGYCGFYSATDAFDLADRYFEAVLKDLSARKVKKYDTLYIGGGTPSSISPLLLSVFLERLFAVTGDVFSESTIEANPESIGGDFLSLVRDFGFSRLSVGCQSTDDSVLKLLGRIHGRKDIFRSIEQIRKKCPDTALNLDMIFDIPTVGNTLQMRTLDDIISLEPEHVSAYSYSFDTAVFSEKDMCCDSAFSGVKQKLTDSGYGKYEISNFAKPGYESRHNIGYWMLADYDGLGASAWSLENFDGGRILSGKVSDVAEYIKSPAEFAETDRTEGIHSAAQELVFGLRVLDGVDFFQLKSRFKDGLSVFDMPVEKLVSEGMLIWKKDRLKLTEKGELLLDSVQEFLWGCLP